MRGASERALYRKLQNVKDTKQADEVTRYESTCVCVRVCEFFFVFV